MAQRRLGQIDMSTGEVLEDGFVAYVAPKRKNGFGTRWIAMAQDALSMMKQFTRVEDFRVLMSLLEQLDFENLITTNQAEIARDLGMDRAQVNRAIKRLLDAEAILEGPKVGISRTYRLNPQFGWKGSARNHVVALDEQRKQRMKDSRISGVIQGGKSNQDDTELDTRTGKLFPEL